MASLRSTASSGCRNGSPSTSSCSTISTGPGSATRPDVHSYLSYEQPTIAAADGVVVVRVRRAGRISRRPQPPPIPPIADTVGNHVIVKVSSDVFLLYAHMKPGHDRRARRPAACKVGQLIGLIGTTGNSTTPASPLPDPHDADVLPRR